MEELPLQCPKCSQLMTLRSVKNEPAKPSTIVFECKSCKLSITEMIVDDPSERKLQ